LTFSQIIVSSDYMKIPDTLGFRNNLYKFLIPNKKIKYWSVFRKEDSSEILLYENKKNNNLYKEKTNAPNKGFFNECLPDRCFTYIVIESNNICQYITNEKKLIDFIGYVDNLPEALLIAKTCDLLFDRKNIAGGAYKIEKDFIYLYLAKFKNCPVSRESFYVKINRKTGEIEYESKGIYYKTDDCYTS